MTMNNSLDKDENINSSPKLDSWEEYLKDLKSKVSFAINMVLNTLQNWTKIDNEMLVQFVNFLIMQDWWKQIPSKTKDSKWKLLEHADYWILSTWMIDENWLIILDEYWIPDSFTLILKWRWNLVRLKWWNIRFTWKK